MPVSPPELKAQYIVPLEKLFSVKPGLGCTFNTGTECEALEKGYSAPDLVFSLLRCHILPLGPSTFSL